MSDDPSDLQPSLEPSPEGSRQSPNPLAAAPVTSSGGLTSTGSSRTQLDPRDPPQDFVRMINTRLQGRLGLSKYLLISSADKKALIAKVWQDPAVQNYYTSNHRMLSDPMQATTFAGQFSTIIDSVINGQGEEPSVVMDYTNMLRAAGVTLTMAEQQALAVAAAAVNAVVPRPFGAAIVSGYDFGTPMPAGGWTGRGESFGWDKHYGVDYGTRAGDRIVSPFAGTAHVQTGVAGYGNYVTVTLDNGWTLGFGHVASGAVQDGERVNPGDLVAISGRNVGSAQGSVTIVTWQDPQGRYANPHDVLDPIFSGATFASLGAAGAAGTGMPTVNRLLDTEYPSIRSDWLTFFGSPPSPEDVYDVLKHGSNPAQWSDYIRGMPSHLENLTQGQYHDLRAMADRVSTGVLGHPATDSIVAELCAGGLTSQQAVTNWYNEHGVTGIPQEDYQKIYKAVQPTMANIFNEPAGADPRDIKNIHSSLREQGRAIGGPQA
jgi:hypothetical protein